VVVEPFRAAWWLPRHPIPAQMVDFGSDVAGDKVEQAFNLGAVRAIRQRSSGGWAWDFQARSGRLCGFWPGPAVMAQTGSDKGEHDMAARRGVPPGPGMVESEVVFAELDVLLDRPAQVPDILI
jgi:hypothetical protein